MRADKIDFSHSNLRQALKAFGVKDGLFKNIKNPDTLKELLTWMTDRPKDYFVDRHKSSHTDFYFNLSSKMFKDLKLPSVAWRALGMPSWYVLKHYGGEPGKKLYKRYIDSQVTTESLLGDYQRQFDSIQKLLKKPTDITESRDNIDRLRFVDEILQKTAKSPADRAFIKKMNNEGNIFLDGKKVKLKTFVEKKVKEIDTSKDTDIDTYSSNLPKDSRPSAKNKVRVVVDISGADKFWVNDKGYYFKKGDYSSRGYLQEKINKKFF